MILNEENKKKFFSYIDIFDQCWNWTGAKVNFGYGVLNSKGKVERTHRISYEIFYGKIYDKLEVCHRCDNPKCVNPLHLFLGTQKDNLRDMYSKGRYPIRKGEKVNTAKLTEQQVKEIRKIYSHSIRAFNIVSLAKKFKVSSTTISKIIRKEHWKHI